MKKYDVQLPFSGVLGVEVEANSKEEALKIGMMLIRDTMDDDDTLLSSIDFGDFEVYDK